MVVRCISLAVVVASAFATAHGQAGEWTWVSGSNVSTAQPGVYGTRGVPAPANIPGNRSNASTATDSNGNFWLFGGVGPTLGGDNIENDLWEFNPGTDEWTWWSGGSADALGVYGTLGVAAPANVPGSRLGSILWTDHSGNIWLFGGSGGVLTGGSGFYNDLWEFQIATGEWTWIAGNNTIPTAYPYCSPYVYGVQGVASPSNVPEGRTGATGWTGSDGSLWMFGGRTLCQPTEAGLEGSLNDLWKFDIASGEWTWVSGSDTADTAGAYGALGVPSGGVPGGRREATNMGTDSSGNLWLFGGEGRDSAGNLNFLNDLWEYTPATNQWTWQSGGTTVTGPGGTETGLPGVYGSVGQYGTGNVPGGREDGAGSIDSKGKLRLFGGISQDARNVATFFNDVWFFDPVSKEWAWVGGTDAPVCVLNSASGCLDYGAPPAYGTLGVPAASNVPGGRADEAVWTDKNENLWVFGGNGIDSTVTFGLLNDVWKFAPPVPTTPVFGTMTFSPTATVAVGTSETITISDTVTYTGVQPTGAVTFVLNSVSYTASCTPSPGSGLGSPETCSAQIPADVIAGLPTASYTVTGSLAPDNNYNAATAATGIFTVTSATASGTTIALTSSLNSSTLGQAVTFTATVTNGAAAPTGSVTFVDGSTVIGTATLIPSGGLSMAAFTTSSLVVGTHPITATYAGASTGAPHADTFAWTKWTQDTPGDAAPGSAAGTLSSALFGAIDVTYSGQTSGLATQPSWGPASTFSGGIVGNAPPAYNGLALEGGQPYTETITFSQPVTDPAFAIWSLGDPSTPAYFKFTAAEPFNLLGGGPSNEYGGQSIVIAGTAINGMEGNGIVQFIGTYSALTFTTPDYEDYYALTVGEDQTLTDNRITSSILNQVVTSFSTPVFGTMTFSPTATVAVGTSETITISDTVTYTGVQPTGAVTFVLNSVTYTATCTPSPGGGLGSPETCSAQVPAATIAGLVAMSYTVMGGIAADSNYNTAIAANGTFAVTDTSAGCSVPAPTSNTMNIAYYTLAESDKDGNSLAGGISSNYVLPALGANGLPVYNSGATASSGLAGPPNDLLADKEITWWSPALNNGGTGGISDVAATGTGVVSLPYSNSNFYPPNGVGPNDLNGFQTAVLTGTLVAPAPETVSFTIASDDMAFLYLDGQIACDDGGVHAAASVPCTTSTIAAGAHTLQIFYADLKAVNAVLDFSVTTSDVGVGAGNQLVFGTMSFSPAATEPHGTSQAITISDPITYSGTRPTGAVSFTLNGVSYPATCTTGGSPETCSAIVPAATIAALPAAAYPVSGSFAGDCSYAAANAPAGTFTITPQQVTFGTMAFAPVATVLVGTSQTITISDTLSYSGVQPTGAVSYILNAVSYPATCTTTGSPETCSATVPAATIAALPAASYTVTGAFAGDGVYGAATAAPGIFTVTLPPPDFSIAAGPLTIVTQHHGSTTISVTPINGFTGTVNLTCGTIPAYVTCEWEPADVTVSGGTASTVLKIDTDGILNYLASTRPARPLHDSGGRRFLLAGLAFPALLLLRRRRKTTVRLLLCVLVLVSVLKLSGCSSHYPDSTTPGTYNITITGTGGGLQHSAVLSLVVTP